MHKLLFFFLKNGFLIFMKIPTSYAQTLSQGSGGEHAPQAAPPLLRAPLAGARPTTSGVDGCSGGLSLNETREYANNAYAVNRYETR